MYTLCPSCRTVFRIQAAHLNAAAGKVRCQHCSVVFVTLGQLYDHVLDAQAARMRQLPPEPLDTASSEIAENREAEAARAAQTAPQEPVEGAVATAPAEEGALLTATLPLPEADWDPVGQPADYFGPGRDTGGGEALADQARRTLEAELQRELQAPRRKRSARRVWQWVAVWMLSIGLAGQFVYMQRVPWSQDPQLRPWVERFCAVLGCEVPLRRSLGMLDLVEREVRDHPERKEVVLVSATFINRANFTQPYPVFEVGFSDLSGTPVAQRRFTPEEYLNLPSVNKGMAPGERVAIQLEVVDPGRRAVSFTMDFR